MASVMKSAYGCVLHDYRGATPCPDCQVLGPIKEDPLTDKLPSFVETNTFNEDAPQSANDIQHGGDHYKSNAVLQHWDLVHIFKLDYYGGNASKYLSRGHKKNGREDYAKAGHYLQKRAELKLFERPVLQVVRLPDGTERDATDVLLEFCHAQNMPGMAIRGFFGLLQGRREQAAESIKWLAENYVSE